MDIDDQERSYFFSEPTILPLPDSSSSSSSSLEDGPRPSYHRPPTPPLLRDIPRPQSRVSDERRTPNATKPKISQQAYARLFSRLNGERETDSNQNRRPRSGSDSHASLPAVLRLLTQETARADAAERQLRMEGDVLLRRVKEAVLAKEKTEVELARVREELSLYKLQLDAAQKEINRAQVIVNEVERARVEAEERSVRDRERIRRMINERAVELAREQGKREGWQEGLETGRSLAWERLNNAYTREMVEEDQSQDGSSASGSSPRYRSQSAQPSQVSRLRTTDNGTVRTTSSDAVSREFPNVRAPIPIRSSIRRPSLLSGRGSALSSQNVHSPEDISVVGRPTSQPHNIIHPNLDALSASPSLTQRTDIPARSPSAAPSQHSVHSQRSRRSLVTTDGWIPTLGPDSVIELPPPHELNQQIDLDAKGPERNGPERNGAVQSGRQDKAVERPRKNSTEHRTVPRAQNHAYGAPSEVRDGGGREYDDIFRERKTGRWTAAMSTTSRNSTAISQYDLVSPPRDYQREREWIRRRNAMLGAERRGHARESTGERQRSTSVRTGPEYTVREQRSVKSDVVGTPTPTGNSDVTYVPIPGGSPRVPATKSMAMNYAQAPRPPNVRNERLLSREGRTSAQPDTNMPSRVRQPLERSTTNTTVIGILVEPPSHSPTGSSGRTIVDPVLLTPDHANMPTPLPQDTISHSFESEQRSISQRDNPISIVWPDTNFPPGFVPLSPIPSITNFNAADHDHHHMHEQYRGGGYQIYAGAAQVPPVAHPSTLPRALAHQTSNSVLFSDMIGSSTADAIPSRSSVETRTSHGVLNFGMSPVPIERPLSVLSGI